MIVFGRMPYLRADQTWRGNPPILLLVADVALEHHEVRGVAVSLRQDLRDRPAHLPDRQG